LELQVREYAVKLEKQKQEYDKMLGCLQAQPIEQASEKISQQALDNAQSQATITRLEYEVDQLKSIHNDRETSLNSDLKL